jgi:hypothetical protein
MSDESLFNRKLTILFKEWDYLQAHIGRLDTMIFNIRQWCITIFAALLAASATLRMPALMLGCLFPILLFWLIDGTWKSIQRNYILRTREIEAFLASKDFEQACEIGSFGGFASPAISSRFGAGSFFERLYAVGREMRLRNVLLMYGSVMLFCFASFLVLLFSLPE